MLDGVEASACQDDGEHGQPDDRKLERCGEITLNDELKRRDEQHDDPERHRQPGRPGPRAWR